MLEVETPSEALRTRRGEIGERLEYREADKSLRDLKLLVKKVILDKEQKFLIQHDKRNVINLEEDTDW